MIRSALLAAVAALGLAMLVPAADPGRVSVAIRAAPVPLARGDAAVVRSGALVYLGGWSLDSADARFGGLSSMAIVGNRLLAISDAGSTFEFRMHGERIASAWIAPLPGGPGRADNKKNRDSESLAVDPATGATWVGFENSNQIWRYDARQTRAEAHSAPAAMAKWPVNSGAEAMVRMRDGRFMVLAEDAPGPDNSGAAVLFTGDPTAAGSESIRFGYRAPAGYVPTDIAQLPDGRLLALHRRFSILDGFSAVLSIFDPADVVSGEAIEGIAVARLAPPLTVDNMEALAVTQERGRTIVWIASDDNFNAIQRTLLMRFALDLRR
jgi:hypothetical protein